MSTTRIHHRACNLCEAICGLVIEVQDGAIGAIRGDKDDPLSRGHICPKAVALKDVYNDPDRLRHPVRRTATGWERISWEEAYEEVIQKLQQTQQQYGKAAVGVYLGNPNVHNYGSTLFLPPFLKALKTPNLFSATSADQLPHHLVAYWMFGHYFHLPVPDLDHTDFLLILGGNPMVSNGSIMTAPDFSKRMRAISKRGQVVVIDPRRSETADKADQHHFIRPGTDAAFLLAMVQVMFADQLVQLGRLTDMAEQLEEVEQAVGPYTPEAVAAYCGVQAADIRALAHAFCKAEKAVCYGRMGVSTQAFGGLCQWLINLINILSGNFDQAGGAMFAQPAVDFAVAPKRAGKTNRWASRVSGYPERFGELPVAAMVEEMTTPGPGQIRSFISVAGNPVLSTADGGALEEALEALDFMVSIDIYINETTRFANIILPPTTGLEVSHYDISFHALAIRNTAKYSPPCFEKSEEQRHDYEILQALSQRMLGAETDSPTVTPEQMLDAGLRTGPYASTGISLDQLKDQPSGIDLGPLQPVLKERLPQLSGNIQLAPEPLLEDLQRLRAAMETATNRQQEYPLQLIGRRQLRSNNSWMHNSLRLVKGGDRCTVLMHPQDAAQHSIEAGEQVRVCSAVGQVDLPAEVSDEIMPGTLSIPHGWGHNRAGVELQVAKEHAGVSINDLMPANRIDQLTGNLAYSGVPVRLEKI